VRKATKRTLLFGFLSSLAASFVFALLPVSRPDSGALAKLLLHPIPVISLFMFGAVMVPALWFMKRWLGEAHDAHLRAQSAHAERRLRSAIDERDKVALELAQLQSSFSPRLALARRIALAIAEGNNYGSVTRELVVTRVRDATGNTATEVEILDVMAGLLAQRVVFADGLMRVGLFDDWRAKLETMEGEPTFLGGHSRS
jgi:hypothetical protein